MPLLLMAYLPTYRFDPSHIPFAHHGIMGSASRDKALPLNITTTVDVTPAGAAGRQA
jgi:phenylpropionate dioxygenase-like ring-hydroxylating dioxygenase large terminal subunit